ncbi:MAG: GntR family transcriptional regulator [Lachnospiraceae bacterium]|nr:GntR family transcriptional regulator [Lachnospiraceae bacterium]
MAWTLDADRPIYTQLVEKIQMDIVSGFYKAGDKIPPVRELATEAAVNPNTMQKALAELERLGLLYTQRTSGRFVTEDEEMINKVKEEMASKHIKVFLENMKQLGYDVEETISVIKELKREEEE